MRTLHVLGGLWLDDDDGPSSGRGAQRRRLALLALIALSPGRRITRDKAISTLWPENTSAEGRRRLSSAVYDLRTMLGDGAIESTGDVLTIGPSARLEIDVEGFEAALGRGDVDAALAVYGGPLLDGVHLSGATEFEEWIASQRNRLRRLHLQALEQAAESRVARGDHAGAAAAALQLVDLEPLSGRAALAAIQTIVATGDRPLALRVADAHRARVHRELGVESDTAVLDAVRRLRALTPDSPVEADGGGAAQSFTDGLRVRASFPETTQARVSESGTARLPARRMSAQVRALAAAALVVAALAGAAYRSLASTANREVAGSLGSMHVAGLSSVAARSTKSTRALEAFIDGEASYQRGRYDAAVKAFQAAIASDSTFALAHYRLSMSLLWQEQPAEFAAVHDSLALRWSSVLSRDEQSLIRAYVAWRRGDYTLADSLYQQLVARDPEDAEAAFQLGETLFHYNQMRGRSIGEARGWFEHVLEIDSTSWGARWHVLLLDAATLTQSELSGRMQRLLESQPDGHVAAELRLFAADAKATDFAPLADSASGAQLLDAAWRRAVFRRDLAGAESLLLRMTAKNRSAFEQETGSFGAGAIRLGRGRAVEALPLLMGHRGTAVEGDGWTLLVHGALADRDGSAPGPIDLDSIARGIDRWHQTLDGFDRPTSSTRVVTSYLDGLLAVARGDTTAAAHWSNELDRLGRPPRDPWLPPEFRNPRELAQTVRAYRHLRAGQCDDALRDLDAISSPYWLGVVASSALAAQSFERYLRAECLLSLGRYAESIAWFRTFEQGTLYDLAFIGVSLRGQAAAHRALGEREAAAAIERRVADLHAQ